ncbi:MAG: cadherin-like beta sandwich domain-containing protein [Actinomycetota bacterium]
MTTSTNETNRTMKHIAKFFVAAIAAFAVLTTGTTVVSAATETTLSAISVSTGSIAPTFAAGTTSYASATAVETTSTTVSATATLPASSIQFRIAGGTYTAASAGSGSATFDIVAGSNTIDILVTNQDGVTTATYSVVVDRGGSMGIAAVDPTDATLSSISGSAIGSLSPVFLPATVAYTAAVDNTTSVTTISAASAQPNASMTIAIDGGTATPLDSATASSSIELKVGATNVVITVVSPDTTVSKTYTLTIYRAPEFPTIPLTCPTLDCTISLHAGTGVVKIKDVTAVGGSVDVPFYGYGVNEADIGLAGSAASTIKVKLGTVIHVSFSEGLPTSTSLSFPSLATSSVAGSGSSYTVKADKLGTMIYEPGTNASAPRQIAMGLVGVLIVVPADCTTGMCAYDPAVTYMDEAVVATTDIDAEFAANPAAFDMGYFGQSRNPDGSPRQVYHLINGKAYPDTDLINVRPTDNVLIRSVNAGVSDKTMGLLGMQQTLLARNASLYTNAQSFVAPLVGPGETADISLAISKCATMGQQYSLMDQGRAMNHGTDSGFGGALTFLNVWTTASAPITCVPDVPGPPPTPGTTTTTSTTTIAPETTISPVTTIAPTTTISPTTTIYIPVTTNPGGGGGGGEPEPEPETKSTVAKSSTTIAAAPPIALPSRGTVARIITEVKIELTKTGMSFSAEVPRYSVNPISRYKFVIATKNGRVFRQGSVKASAPLKLSTWNTRNLSVGTYTLSVYALSSTGKVLEMYTETIEVKVDSSKALKVDQQLTPRAITPKVIISASGIFQK